MTSQAPPEIAELRARMEQLCLPAEARERIQQRVERRVTGRPRPVRGRLVLVLASILLASAATAALRWWRGSSPPQPAASHPAPAAEPRPRPAQVSRPAQPPPAPAVLTEPSRAQRGQPPPRRKPRVKRPRRRRPPPPPAEASDLAQQVAAFRRALAALGRNDQLALARWRAMARRWPDGPLRQEVELRTVETLVRLERWPAARRAARAFRRRYPGSARTSAVRRLLDAIEAHKE